ncbi:hypothetical protein PoB_004182000 [Plakobranchus ocellatus]|uniref:Uncharacterized protein n=1 Tax=Plakobranchus ocellatus TaxID=259542 RepID=A0AAV4B8B8_9GAST|nr:hypothetical protein PoB_004182000 [Plakobranchus ocellatus]
MVTSGRKPMSVSQPATEGPCLLKASPQLVGPPTRTQASTAEWHHVPDTRYSAFEISGLWGQTDPMQCLMSANFRPLIFILPRKSQRSV